MTEPDKGSYPSTYTLSSGEAAKAELRELREVAEEMAGAAKEWDVDLSSRCDCPARDRLRAVLSRYEALRDG